MANGLGSHFQGRVCVRGSLICKLMTMVICSGTVAAGVAAHHPGGGNKRLPKISNSSTSPSCWLALSTLSEYGTASGSGDDSTEWAGTTT